MILPDIDTIWSLSEHNFNDIALQIFHFQVKNNTVYGQYVNLIDQDPTKIEHYTQIPFLPISFFKTHKVVSLPYKPEAIFESSSTTGKGTSKSYVKDIELYHNTCKQIIEERIGSLSDYEVLGLLPSYLERKNSSLVSMVKYFMDYNKQSNSFFLYNHNTLEARLLSPGKKLLFGVSFALLDFAENHKIDSSDLTIIETGGMKGRKEEVTKDEVYSQLQNSFENATILSEYGMTELMSQAYSDSSGRYTTPNWMKVLPRADNDPLESASEGKTAALNIIDLANLDTCSFIATDDLGRVYSDGSFEIIGRLDHADLRGCSLMIE
jgi:hypothetical protein